MNGRFLIYVDGAYTASTYGIRRAIQLARAMGQNCEVVDRVTDETVWSGAEPWRWEYA